MPPPSNEEVIRRYVDAHVSHDHDTLGLLRSDDWFEEWPQSGERVRGHANDMQIMRNWPGGDPQTDAAGVRIVGSEDRWVLSPSWTAERVAGSGEAWWMQAIGRYPDGSTWFVSGFFHVRDGKVRRETWFFAPPLEAPAWRSQWVERYDPREPSAGR
jgi:hypothetical protein